MRAIELYEWDLKALGIKRDGTGERLTLKAINKLKRIRANRRIEQDRKLSLVRAMYGNTQQDELERKEAELELAHQAIQQEIEASKITDEARAKISAMARETLGRRLKA